MRFNPYISFAGLDIIVLNIAMGFVLEIITRYTLKPCTSDYSTRARGSKINSNTLFGGTKKLHGNNIGSTNVVANEFASDEN